MSYGIPYIDKDINELNSKIEQLTKQKDQAYSERNKVVAALAHILSYLGNDVGIAEHQGEDLEPDWRTVLVIGTKENCQITWHFHDSEKHLLDGLPTMDNYEYDGHTTDEKYQRLFEFVGIKQLIAEASE